MYSFTKRNKIKMEFGFYLKIVIGVVILLGLFFFTTNSGKKSFKTIDYPPFTIQKRTIKDRRFSVNTGYFSTTIYNKYKVFYKGEPVVLPKASDQYTGIPGIWNVFMLEDAPQPALLLGSRLLYLLTEENNMMKITPFKKENFGNPRMQWLDSEGGQPGQKNRLLVSQDTDASHNLSEGEYVLINGNTVLEIATLAIYPLNKYSKDAEEYDATKVVAFSLDKSEVVFMGNRGFGEYEYALLSFRFKTNGVYSIPIDRNEMRLDEPYNLSPTWFKTYFEWEKSSVGSYSLKKKALDKLPNWEGRIEGDSYSLSSVKQELMQIFFDFTKSVLVLKDSDIDVNNFDGMVEYRFEYEALELSLSFLDENNTIYFSKHFTGKDSKEYNLLMKRVGNAFNSELRKGKYQDLFMGY